MQPIYKIKNIYYIYDIEPVLEIKELNIAPASIVGLVGPNGSGKSTLLRLMAFLVQPNKGEIFLNNQSTNHLDKKTRLEVTLLTQKTHLMKRTVYQNIIYGLKIRHIDKKYYREAAQNALNMVGLDFNIFARRQWNTLSGGEAQRVALAARLIFKPQVLLMDEPTANVDSFSSELIKKASMIAKKKWGTTLVITSHDTEWLNSICDTVIFMSKGKLTTQNNSNLITGPWSKMDKKLFTKCTDKGQRILVSPPPHKNAIASIDPIDIRIFNLIKNDFKKNKCILHGKIRQLKLEKQTSNILIQIIIDNLVLTSTITAKQLLDMTLYPGKRISITYFPEKVQWQ